MYICFRLARMIAQPDHLIVRPNLGAAATIGPLSEVLRSVPYRRRVFETLNVVNRQLAVCRVMRVLSSGHPESHTYTIYLNCRGPQSRETSHDGNIDGMTISVTIQFEQGAEAVAVRPSIDMYKRCPEIRPPSGAPPRAPCIRSCQ
jgi:hypothetical protein